MLNKKEEKVLLTLKSLLSNKNSCLLSPTDILRIGGIKDLNESTLEIVLESLRLDGYIDLVYSDRKGEKIYCVGFKEKGLAYQRNKEIIKRNLRYKFILTVVFAVISFIVGIVLKAIF